MTGRADRSPIPLDVRAEYWADRVYVATASMAAAFDRAAREDGISQEVIAARLQKDSGQISRWLRGQRNLTIRTLSDMALAMDCELRITFVPLKAVPVPNYQFELPSSVPVSTFSPGKVSTFSPGNRTTSPGNRTTLESKVA